MEVEEKAILPVLCGYRVGLFGEWIEANAHIRYSVHLAIKYKKNTLKIIPKRINMDFVLGKI